jgi:mRNA deadenylase 3'-5' endonuclease subunit Ccr4
MIKNNTKMKKDDFPLDLRKWMPNDREPSSQTIRILTYNILSQNLLPLSIPIGEEELKKTKYLQWEVRKEKILTELRNIKADIVCLQEFEEHDDGFIQSLDSLNYDVYKIVKLDCFSKETW